MDLSHSIVKLIEKNDGRWSWYQLDRGLSTLGMDGGRDLMKIVRTLVEGGLITEQPGKVVSQPKYSITEKGREFLRGLT